MDGKRAAIKTMRRQKEKMAKSTEESVTPIVGCGCWLAIGLVQMAAEFAGLTDWLGLNWFVALVLCVFTGGVPVVGSIVGFVGAIKGWGWSWYAAAALFGAPLVLPFFLIGVYGAGSLSGSLLARLTRK